MFKSFVESHNRPVLSFRAVNFARPRGVLLNFYKFVKTVNRELLSQLCVFCFDGAQIEISSDVKIARRTFAEIRTKVDL